MFKRLVLTAAMVLCIAAGLSAQEKMKSPMHGGKTLVVVTHEVKDYAAWRKVFDADEPNRKKGGFKVQGVYADRDNPNIVSVIGEFPNPAAVDAFINSPGLKEAMEKGGVLGKPDVKVLVPKPK